MAKRRGNRIKMNNNNGNDAAAGGEQSQGGENQNAAPVGGDGAEIADASSEQQGGNENNEAAPPVTDVDAEAAAAAAAAEAAGGAGVTAASSALSEDMVDPKLRSAMQSLIGSFDTYRQAMQRGRPLTDEEGQEHQAKLWALIKSVIGRQGEEFTPLFAKMLSLFLEERSGGVLDPKLRFRFFGALKIGKIDARNFERILEALLYLSNPQDRKITLKQVDLNGVFKNYSDKAGAQRVFDFFGL